MSAAAAVEAIRAWAGERALDFRHDASTGHGAVFSLCGRYRYLLWRDALDEVPILAIAMLNPSKADHLSNDPTIARCHARARGDGAALLVWNLFALRETDPQRLRKRRGPVGRHNDDAIRLALGLAGRTIAAWGVHGEYRGRDRDVARLLAGTNLLCLGMTKEGHPRHPLYLKAGTAPQDWPVR